MTWCDTQNWQVFCTWVVHSSLPCDCRHLGSEPLLLHFLLPLLPILLPKKKNKLRNFLIAKKCRINIQRDDDKTLGNFTFHCRSELHFLVNYYEMCSFGSSSSTSSSSSLNQPATVSVELLLCYYSSSFLLEYFGFYAIIVHLPPCFLFCTR